ncbi:hypothetical protein FACS1894187_24050 [Synergistales bacterium]|nr:hypothetical protein FACS1894187_24050 [Synergistales bacterium]
MPNMSNDMENKLLDFLFRGQPYTPPATVYVAMFTTTPTDEEPGEEPTAPSYARAPISCTLEDWSGTDSPDSQSAPSSGTSGTIFNISEISFPDPQEDWGSVAYIGLFDAPTGGEYLFWSELTAPRDFVVGDVNIRFRPAEMSIQIDN